MTVCGKCCGAYPAMRMLLIVAVVHCDIHFDIMHLRLIMLVLFKIIEVDGNLIPYLKTEF